MKYPITVLALFVALASACFGAGANILIIEPQTGVDGKEIRGHLQKILQGSGMKDANVGLTGPSQPDQNNLSGWIYDPNHDAEERLKNLQGKGGTAWDYVVILENPQVIETFPGWYAQGVHDVAKEVEKGKGEAVVLMQWPGAKSQATLKYYREVAYRVGRGRYLKVVPAGLAWKAAGSPAGKDAAYIAAASIYSRLWNKDAADSSYTHNDALAKMAFKTVTANKGAKQYTGPFTSAPNGIHTIGGNQKRVIRIINDGWRSRGYPLESVDNGNIWKLTSKMGLVNRVTTKEIRGASSGLSRKGTPNDHADLHYIASTAIRDTTAGLYVSYLSNYVYNRDAQKYADQIKKEFNHDAPSLAKRWDAGDKRLRQLPPYLLLSQIFRHFQTHDKKVIDIHLASKPCYAAYIVTMLTGRCPMVLEDAGTKGYAIQQIGYETAWRFSTLYGRAPGFKTWPDNPLRMTVDPTHSATMKVAFALPPKSNVTVSVSSTNAVASPQPRTLTFTPTNYNVPQAVTVSVAKDAAAKTTFDIIFTTKSDDVVYDELKQSWTYSVNSRPVADARKVTVFADTVSPIQLTGSDPDEKSTATNPQPPPQVTEPLTYSIAKQPDNGVAKMAGSVVAYTPKPGFTGTDRFTFKTKDFSVFSKEAIVEVTVKPSARYGGNLMVNGDGELFPFTEFGWAGKDDPWSQSVNKHTGNASIYPGRNRDTELYQDIDVAAYSKAINGGVQSFKFDGYVRLGRGEMSIAIECRDAAGKVLATHTIDNIPQAKTPGFVNRSAVLKPPANTTVVRVRLIAKKVRRGRTSSCLFDAFSLVAVQP